jgi:hypothetical protein
MLIRDITAIVFRTAIAVVAVAALALAVANIASI